MSYDAEQHITTPEMCIEKIRYFGSIYQCCYLMHHPSNEHTTKVNNRRDVETIVWYTP